MNTSERVSSLGTLMVPVFLGALLLGSCQSLVISRHVQWAKRWAALTAAGWSATSLALLALWFFAGLDDAWVLASFALVPGAGLGAGQWLAIRGGVKRAGWWILTTLLAWTLTSLMFWIAFQLTEAARDGWGLVAWIPATLSFGSVTGFALIDLLWRPGISSAK